MMIMYNFKLFPCWSHCLNIYNDITHRKWKRIQCNMKCWLSKWSRSIKKIYLPEMDYHYQLAKAETNSDNDFEIQWYRYQVLQIARSSLTFTVFLCLCVCLYVWVSVCLGVGLYHPLSLSPSVPIVHQSWQVFWTASSARSEPVAYRLTPVCACVGIHKGRSLMCSAFLRRQCLACLIRITWMVCEMGCNYTYTCCFVNCCI